jgi:hypothetical protein
VLFALAGVRCANFYGPSRANSAGRELSVVAERDALLAAHQVLQAQGLPHTSTVSPGESVILNARFPAPKERKFSMQSSAMYK